MYTLLRNKDLSIPVIVWIVMVVLVVCMYLLEAYVYAVCPVVKRSPHAVRMYMKSTGYPHGRKGYVVDHIIPLCLGGQDSIENMQWQTAKESYVKDKEERKQCAVQWGHK
jgi:hypothetical protein